MYLEKTLCSFFYESQLIGLICIFWCVVAENTYFILTNLNTP